MKRIFLFLLITFNCSNIFAQDNYRDVVKCFYVGVTGQGMDFNGLNKILEKNNYDLLNNSLACVSFQKSAIHLDRYFIYYGLDVSLSNNNNTSGNYTRYNYFRPNVGVEFPVQIDKDIFLQPHAGLSCAVYSLRLYNAIPDTTILENYIDTLNDLKRVTATQLFLDIGLNCRMNIFFNSTSSAILGVGYMLPLGQADWRHDLGKFENAPATNLGTWYVQFKFGIFRHLHIVNVEAQL